MGAPGEDGWRVLSRAASWAAIGLAGNPFINVIPGEHLEWVELPPGVEEALAKHPARVELVGAHKGSGKSTALRAIVARTPGAVYLHAPAPLPADVGAPPLFALDEADLWSAGDVKQLDRALPASTLLLGTHRGFARTLPALRSFDLEQLPTFGWLERRVAAARPPPFIPGPSARLRTSSAEDSAPSDVQPFEFVALARTLPYRHVKYAVLRVLYELAEELARGGTFSPALLAHCEARAAQDPTLTEIIAG